MKEIDKDITLEDIPLNIMDEDNCTFSSLLDLIQDYTSLFVKMYEKEIAKVANYTTVKESNEEKKTNKNSDDISLNSSNDSKSSVNDTKSITKDKAEDDVSKDPTKSPILQEYCQIVKIGRAHV